jgi:hypothetical protein
VDRVVRIGLFALALVVLVLDANGGPGWLETSGHAVVAARGEHLAAAPLFDLLSQVALLLPAGEAGFRLGVLAAVIGACTLAGVVAAASALIPKHPVASAAGVALLLITPAFREASAVPTPSLLAACGAAWSLAYALKKDAVRAIAACVLVVGSAPWLGAAWTIAIAIWLRRDKPVVPLGALGFAVIAWWLTASGTLPGATGSLTAMLDATGRGPAAIIVGAGLLAVGFGAATRLPNAALIGVFVLIAALHDIVIGGSAPLLLVVLAIAIAIIPAAIARATGMTRTNLVAVGAAVPLLAVAAATGAVIRVDKPGAAPAQLARDLIRAMPPGPGVFVANRAPTWLALDYAQTIAGERPDLSLVPPLPADQADAIVAQTLRGERIAASDSAAFGRLDLERAIPRGRGFQLVGDKPARPSPVLPPAKYASTTGEQQAALLAVERARLEAASGRLDLAARAVGLAGTRFNAADLAVLAATTVVRERPALFGLLPLEATPPGPWLYDLFGDDLAWVAGLPDAPLPAEAPMPRKLHAKWRAILSGKGTPDDPDIAALGERAVTATRALFVAKPPPTPPPQQPTPAPQQPTPAAQQPTPAPLLPGNKSD